MPVRHRDLFSAALLSALLSAPSLSPLWGAEAEKGPAAAAGPAGQGPESKTVGAKVTSPPDKAAGNKAKTASTKIGVSGKADGQPLQEDPFAAADKPAAPEKPAVSYEDLLKNAIPVTDLATLVEPLYGHCDEKDDLPRRQCEGMRRYLLERLRTHTFVALSDSLPETSPYDASAKEIDMDVSGCLACANPPVVAGEVRYLSTRAPQRVVAGKASGVPMGSHQLAMETKVRADRFLERIVPRLRVQLIFRVGQPFGDGPAAAYRGVTIIPVAHRVYDRCTGQVAAASPASHGLVKVVADKTCPRKGAEELSEAEMVVAAKQAALPEHLTSREVDEALRPVQEKIHDCYVEFEELGGTAKVQLTLGGEGKLTQVSLRPPFDKAAIGVCIRSQIKTAVFPRFRGDPMHIDYAFQVN